MLVYEFYKPIDAQEIAAPLYHPSIPEEQMISSMLILAELHKLQAQTSNIQSPILMIANEPHNSGDENIEVFNIESALSSLNLGFKIGDVVLDFAKLYHNPNKDNLKQVVVDLNYVTGIYYGGGVNYLAVSGYNVFDEVSNGNYLKAITQATTSIGFAVLPYVFASFPSIAIPCGIALTSYNGYQFVVNALKLIKEFDTPEQQLKSAQDYSNLYHYLSETSLQTIVDFDKLAAEIDLYIELIGEDVLES
jgi:hypothetical protein